MLRTAGPFIGSGPVAGLDERCSPLEPIATDPDRCATAELPVGVPGGPGMHGGGLQVLEGDEPLQPTGLVYDEELLDLVGLHEVLGGLQVGAGLAGDQALPSGHDRVHALGHVPLKSAL